MALEHDVRSLLDTKVRSLTANIQRIVADAATLPALRAELASVLALVEAADRGETITLPVGRKPAMDVMSNNFVPTAFRDKSTA